MSMKRNLCIIITFVFSIVHILSFVPHVSANEMAPLSPSATPAIVQYDLAFPGILPDHPLYILKVLRDRISLLLMSDSTQKINLYLKNADKGILAAAILIDKHNIPLAKQTTLKAEHNMTLLSQELSNIEDTITEQLITKLRTASLKHQEVLASLLPRVPANDQETFKQVIDFSRRNLQEIEKYSLLPQ